MLKSSDNLIDHLICAALAAAAMLTFFALAVQPLLPHGDVQKAALLVLLSKQGLAAPEPDESLRYILLCLAAVPAAWGSWQMMQKFKIRIPDAAGLLLIPLWGFTGWFGELLLPVLTGGVILTCLILKFRLTERFRTGCSWPVNAALLLVLILTVARRFPLPADLENAYGDHMNIILYALNSALHGLPDIHLYGFHPMFLAPVFRVIGLSLLSAELVMNILYFTAFALMADAARRLIRSNFLLLGFLTTAAFTCGSISYMMLHSDIYDPYFACWPLRFLGPALALNLASRRNVPLFPLWGGMLAAGALWFNPDSGIAVTGALFVLFLFSGGIRPLLSYLGIFLIAVPGWACLLYLINGFAPDWRGFLAYMQIFWQTGYMMLPIRGAPIWFFPVLILIAGLTWSLKTLPVSRESRPVLFLAVLGAGLLNYYIGRSHIGNLLACTWPAMLLLFCFADHARRDRKITFAVMLFLGCCSMALVLIKSPQIIWEWNRLIRQFCTPSIDSYKVIAIKKLAGDTGTVNILPKYQQGYFYAETGLKPGIANFSMSEMLFLQDQKRVTEALKKSNVPLIITRNLQPAPELMPFYQEAGGDEELNIRLYLPVNRREAPAPRPPAKP